MHVATMGVDLIPYGTLSAVPYGTLSAVTARLEPVTDPPISNDPTLDFGDQDVESRITVDGALEEGGDVGFSEHLV